ncbi:DUF3800 domain-containing protein [Nocardia cyriacigeorgica]|uniref:DUF3800 domain-containing protein n=1 Tax=Nocardia cyriacigeorgica TaxID=135487 RepID=A0A5R8PME8_9NOCA|nr:DUF3800 domain-containing protein [Nocardia cyriacigeorgica]TLG18128.1 DUF3800 domain-containing protein [Nocardia cyriacigeorgica]
MLTAWGDESGSQPSRDPDTYLVAAVLIDSGDVPPVRCAMDALRLPDEKKVHWHSSTDSRREDLVAALVDIPAMSVVVVHHQARAGDRRHRRKCLEYLFPELARMPCDRLTLESRGPQDNSDLDLVQKFRSRKIIGSGFRVNHLAGPAEPMLWIADVVCGAVVQHRVGNPRYLDKLGGLVDIHHL